MQFPEKPTCHPPMGEMFKIGNDFEWREPKPDTSGSGAHIAHHFRTCSWCGSIHPEDFLTLIERGATLEIPDMSVGWPHKFYINGARENDADRDLWGKWYNAHLGDEGLDDEAFDKIANAILRLTDGRIVFARPGGKLAYVVQR